MPTRYQRGHFMRTLAYTRSFEQLGSVWGGADCDEAESANIREWVELLAEIPMGYGRVGRVPTQLTPIYAARRLWR